MLVTKLFGEAKGKTTLVTLLVGKAIAGKTTLVTKLFWYWQVQRKLSNELVLIKLKNYICNKLVLVKQLQEKLRY